MRKISIVKMFDFDAAHHLGNVLGPDHKCSRLHGHTYRARIHLHGPINNENGMLVDYAVIAAAWAGIHDVLDHRFLNDIQGLEISTTENLAHWIFDAMKRHLGMHREYLVAVRVYESSTTWAQADA